jgi:hypothetical protein
MKKVILLLGLLSISACHLLAQTNQTDITKQKELLPKATTIPTAPPAKSTNQISKQISYSGALIQVYKADNPLQLINPFAPAKYGSGFANLSVDPITRKPQGIALFSINF